MAEEKNMKHRRSLLKAGTLWWMAQVYRPLVRRQHTSHAACFDPGLLNMLRYEQSRLWHALFDHDRWQWRKLRLRRLLQ